MLIRHEKSLQNRKTYQLITLDETTKIVKYGVNKCLHYGFSIPFSPIHFLSGVHDKGI
jgi:hypothetical protein